MADMFTVPSKTMKDIIEFLDDNPISYTYPFANKIATLAGILPSTQTLIDFINHIGAQTARIELDLREAESLADRISDYDDMTPEESFKTMFGTLHPDFEYTLDDWIVRAATPSLRPAILAEMEDIVTGEPAAFIRAQQITQKIANAAQKMNLIEAADEGGAGSTAGKIMSQSMQPAIKAALQSAKSALNALQQVAEFGTALPPPGVEFKNYLEKAMGEVQSALQSGDPLKMVNGALQIGKDILPAGIVSQITTNFPEFQQTLDKVSNVIKEADGVVSQTQRAINAVKDDIAKGL